MENIPNPASTPSMAMTSEIMKTIVVGALKFMIFPLMLKITRDRKQIRNLRVS